MICRLLRERLPHYRLKALLISENTFVYCSRAWGIRRIPTCGPRKSRKSWGFPWFPVTKVPSLLLAPFTPTSVGGHCDTFAPFPIGFINNIAAFLHKQLKPNVHEFNFEALEMELELSHRRLMILSPFFSSANEFLRNFVCRNY